MIFDLCGYYQVSLNPLAVPSYKGQSKCCTSCIGGVIEIIAKNDVWQRNYWKWYFYEGKKNNVWPLFNQWISFFINCLQCRFFHTWNILFYVYIDLFSCDEGMKFLRVFFVLTLLNCTLETINQTKYFGSV